MKEVEAGLHERYPNGIPDDVRRQADYEVGVITQMGFPGYFLVVADFINWSKNNGIRVGPGRGRARARWPHTRCASPTSTRCSTGSSSSAS